MYMRYKFFYDLVGHEITELSSTGSWNRGEVYAGSRISLPIATALPTSFPLLIGSAPNAPAPTNQARLLKLARRLPSATG
jgi:hypothetical protein